MRRLVPPLLRTNPGFRSFWTGQTISLFGDQVTLLAVPLLAVVSLDAGAAQMGLLTAAGMAPNLLFSVHAGAWADRRPSRRRLMVATDVGRAALLATIPVAAALGLLTLAQLYVVAFAVGSLGVLFFVSYNTLFVSLVERDEYIDASSLLNGSRALSLVGGNGIAGILVQVLTAPGALLFDAASYLLSASFLRRISAAEPEPAEPHGEPGRRAAGRRFIARTPLMRACLGASATLNLFNAAFFALLVLYATEELGIGAAALGLALGVGALGSVLGTLIAGRLSRRIGFGHALILAFVLSPAPLLLVPAAGGSNLVTIPMVAVAEFLSGIGMMILDVGLGALFAALIPDQLRSRVSGAYMLVNYGVRPVGALGGGLLAATIGLRPTLWIAAVGALAGVLWLLPSPLSQLRVLPPRALAR
ncbi:MAG TPA: MFS transporter [Solirubrobacterales bacterium]|jgi:MFS family permease